MYAVEHQGKQTEQRFKAGNKQQKAEDKRDYYTSPGKAEEGSATGREMDYK